MSSDPRAAYLARAKQLEDSGQQDAAVDAFVQAGMLGEAARIRMSQRRYLEAGHLLLRNLGVDPSRISSVAAGRKKEALTAAICFAKGGRGDIAVEMFLGLGEHARAIELLERAGDQVGVRRVRDQMAQAQHGRPFAATPGPPPPAVATPRSPIPVIAGVAAPAVAPAPPLRTPQQLEQAGSYAEAIEAYARLKQFTEAARVCQILGRWDQAGAFYLDAAMPYEAAVCFQYAKDTRACLDALVMVPKEDPRYREAAVGAVTIASELGLLDFRLEQFLGRFMTSGPQNGREIEIFYLLAKLYQRHEKIESAKEAYEKIVAVDPSFHDVRAQLAAVQAQLRPMKHVEHLPDLPEMPSLPTIPSQDRPGFDGDRTNTDVNEGLPGAMQHGAQQAGGTPVVRTTVAKGAVDLGVEGSGFHLGATVAGRYKIEDRIGKGGMAVVYRAHDMELGEKIAIKVFSQPIEDDELLLHRFKQELVLSRQLTHPNIIRLHDIGQWQSHRYITMELLHGRELKSQLGSPMSFQEGIEYLIQACAGLQHAHDRGVVHRDVKPQNFFITQEKQLKVMDFGIAKRQSAPGLTVAGMIAGTPNYMSPEQINGFSNVTASTDIYALGVIAYEMFTGSVPFTHPELMPILMMHLQTPPEPPRRRNPNIPEALERVILRLMEKSPANRYPSCRALADELNKVRGMI